LLVANPRSLAADAILQYYEARWETIERRLPDVFVAGYDALWLPPPSIADSGGFSVGYDVFDRFDFGSPFRQSLYGTTQGFTRLADELDYAGVDLFVDIVLNHNGFRDAGSKANDGVTSFPAAGDYPGFVTTLPSDVDGDFHGIFEGGDLNGRLAGLIDIAQDKNHVFTRHPIPGSPNPIPNETPRIENRRLYPDPTLDDGIVPGRKRFNLANPDAGVPTQENATGLLMRSTQWMIETQKIKGYRIDAVKHMPTWFMNNFYDETVKKLGVDKITGNRFTPFSFGENFTSDFGLLGAYVRKEFGNPFGPDYNRDALDFPLFFTMRNVFDAGGFGDMRQIENASFDGYDGNANDGTYGVLFAASHDKGAIGNGNVVHAHILTRTGFPNVYYNAKEFGDGRDFPRDGRGDAIGSYGSNLIPTLVRINDVYAQGAHFTRWIDGDVYIYERLNSMIVGLNDRADNGFDGRTVNTGFRNIRLYELTGNPHPDTFPFIDIGANGVATINVPRGGNSSGRGYVVYGMHAPESTLTILNPTGVIPPDTLPTNPSNADHARTRLTPLHIVTGNNIQVRLTTTATYNDDNALIKLNYGLPIDANPGVLIQTGRFAGFEAFTKTNTPGNPGAGLYELDINATSLPDGMHYIETVCFHPRLPDEPAVFDVQRKVVWLDRVKPPVNLLFPTRTGNNDITSSAYEAAVSVDRTADNVFIVQDSALLTDEQIMTTQINGNNQARRHDRLEWRRVLTNLPAGNLQIAVVAYEPTGNFSLTRFGGIDVDVPQPQVLIGQDTDAAPGVTNFQSLPGSTNSPAYPNDIVVRVRKEVDFGLPVGGPTDIRTLSWNDGDFTVELKLDDGPWVAATNFTATPSLNQFFQNDQNGGDQFDEFRFRWRGYTRGNHTIRARAQVLDPLFPIPNETVHNIFIENGTPGPAVAITNPAPPVSPAQPVTLNNPSQIQVQGTIATATALFARLLLEQDGRSTPLATYDASIPANVNVTTPVGSFSIADIIPPGAIPVTNGSYTVRLQATTGPNGTGIQAEATSPLNVTGVGDSARLPVYVIDAAAKNDLLSAYSSVLATTPADGAGPYADFAGEGSLTELRARFEGSDLFVALRGEFFGANTNDLHVLLLDVNSGSGQGVTNLDTQLDDQGDGLRQEISRLKFSLSGASLAGVGIDALVAVTSPNTAAGYTLGADGLAGSLTNFQYQGALTVGFDANTSTVAAASGAAIAGSKTIEFRLPLDLLGSPDPTKIRLAAITGADGNGFPNPNTIPENASQAFDPTQTLTAMTTFTRSPKVLINEISVGDAANPTLDRIELFNPTASSVSLAGWALRMSDAANERRDYVFPAGFQIPAGGYVVVSDQGGTSPPTNTATLLYTGFNITWHHDRAGAVALVDRVGLGVDYVEWRDRNNGDAGTSFSSLPYDTTYTGTTRGPVHGQSLGRSATSADTNAAGDWEDTGGINSSVPTFGGPNNAAPTVISGVATD